MKKSFKILALLLAVIMMVSVFVACNDGEGTTDETTVNNEDTNGSEDETTGEVMPDIEKKNYDSTFYLSVMGDVNPMDRYWVEESNDDVLSAALFERQERVKSYLGVEVFASSTDGFEVYTEAFKTAVKNKSGGVDTLLTHVSSGVSGLITEGVLTPFEEMDGIDLDADYWNQEFMDALSINDHYLLGFSDFNILYTYVIAYNKDLLANYEDHLDKSVYDMVDNYEWTLQQFCDIAKLGFINRGGEDKNQYGLTGLQWVPWCGFLEAAGVNLVELNDQGTYEMSYNNEIYSETTQSVVAMLSDLAAAEYTCVDFMSTGPATVPFEDNRSLMTLASTNELPTYLNHDIDFGVLPYPVFESNQKEYRSLQWGGYMAIPAYMENPTMVGETLEMLSFYSEDVKTAYYQKLLGKQVGENPDDRRMLEIVWDSVCTDFGQTFDEVTGFCLYMLPSVTASPDKGGTSYAQYTQQRIQTSKTAIRNFFKKVDKKY
ncbi:MAG: extracellular solute-binding protein [Clostridia bacterium]|nr:extracellular solute-binding protein [Clostridia bacterium]